MDHHNNNTILINNRYQKLEKLGEGGYGRVTKCCLITQENELEKNTKFFAVKKYFLKKVKNATKIFEKLNKYLYKILNLLLMMKFSFKIA